MALAEWWADDPAERFWLEITDRDSLGENLHAPQTDDAGREYWSYELVRHVRQGDVVFHWWKLADGGPSLVGYSRAVGTAEASTLDWQAHGTVGRAKGHSTVRPSWLLPLEEYRDLATPLTLDRLRASERTVRQIKATLERKYGGSLYFPFALSEKRPIRTAQGYLTKFPAALVRGMPELAAAFEGVDLSSRDTVPGRRDRRRSGAGWMQDPVARRAIERHAVEWALRHLASEGYDVEDVGAWFSYDIRARRGPAELHVEVKGTTGEASTIQLTANEVDEGEGTSRLLVVVDQIECARSGEKVVTSGGRARLWWEWVPAEENLLATNYRYTLPDGAGICRVR